MADLADPRLEALGMLIEAHAAVTTAIERDLDAESDLPVQFLGVLIRLGRSPDNQLRMTQLAHEMSITASGLTRLVDRMERAGLIEREPCPDDGRGLLAVLSTEGDRRLRELLPRHLDHIEARYAQHLSPTQLDTLTGLLRRARDGVRSMEN